MKKILLCILSTYLTINPLSTAASSCVDATKVFFKELGQYIKGDPHLDATSKKTIRNVLFGTAGTVIVGAGSSIWFYFVHKNKQDIKQEIFNPKDYVLEIKPQSTFAKIKNIKRQGFKQAQTALATGDIKLLKDAIQNKKVLDHKNAPKLLSQAKSAEEVTYIVVNFPQDKKSVLLEYQRARVQQCIINHEDLSLVKRLIEINADTNEFVTTALLVDAVANNNPETFLLLVDCNPNLKAKDANDKSVLQYVKEQEEFMQKLQGYKQQYPHAVAKVQKLVQGKKVVQFS